MIRRHRRILGCFLIHSSLWVIALVEFILNKHACKSKIFWYLRGSKSDFHNISSFADWLVVGREKRWFCVSSQQRYVQLHLSVWHPDMPAALLNGAGACGLCLLLMQVRILLIDWLLNCKQILSLYMEAHSLFMKIFIHICQFPFHTHTTCFRPTWYIITHNLQWRDVLQ